MNEEEKKIFNFLKHTYNLDFKTCIIKKCDVKNIVNLIEKQQKEIEELKIIEKLFHYRIEEIEPEIFISKDKIKEKIKKIKEDEEFYRERDRMYEFDGKINILEELLGE